MREEGGVRRGVLWGRKTSPSADLQSVCSHTARGHAADPASVSRSQRLLVTPLSAVMGLRGPGATSVSARSGCRGLGLWSPYERGQRWWKHYEGSGSGL